MKVDIYITIDPLTPKRTKKRYACFLVCTLKNGSEHKSEYFGEMTGTYHHVTLTAMVNALGKLNYKCDVYLHANNGYVLGYLKNFLPMWAKKELPDQQRKVRSQ